MLDFSLLESFVHASFDLFAKGIHLVGLTLDLGGLGSNDFLVPGLHVSVSLFLFHLLSLDLDLMSLGILLLSSKLLLDLLQVKKLGTQLEGKWKLSFELLTVFLKLANMSLLKSTDGLLVLLFDLCKGFVPSLVEVLVLHEVRMFYLFSFARLIVYQLLTTTIEVLDLKLLNSVLCHLCLDVLAFSFALLTVVFQNGTKREYKVKK